MNELERRIEALESKAIKCKCACDGRGGEHECGCLPNFKHRCYPPPDRFQKKAVIHTAECEGCGEPVSHPPPSPEKCIHGHKEGCCLNKPKDEVEEKILQIAKDHVIAPSKLYELVALARKT